MKTPLLIELTSRVVSAYVQKHVVSPSDFRLLLGHIHTSLAAKVGHPELGPVVSRPKPAVSISMSLQDDHVTCLNCGRELTSLKRHLRVSHSQTPDEYRQNWSLPRDYPMVAPNYAEIRSGLAKSAGLGTKGRKKLL